MCCMIWYNVSRQTDFPLAVFTSMKTKRRVNKTKVSNYHQPMHSAAVEIQSKSCRKAEPASFLMFPQWQQQKQQQQKQRFPLTAFNYLPKREVWHFCLLVVLVVVISHTWKHLNTRAQRGGKKKMISSHEVRNCAVDHHHHHLPACHHYGWMSGYFVNVNKHHFQEFIAYNQFEGSTRQKIR